MHSQRFEDVDQVLDDLRSTQMFRTRRVIGSRQGRELLVDGRRLLNFSSNDYLGLAGDPRVAESLARASQRWGVGSGASHLISGHTEAHHELELRLAEVTNRPRALLFGSGYAANVGTVNALLSTGDFVYQDRLNHASLLDGGWLSRAEFNWFDHNCPAALGRLLATNEHQSRRVLIVSDGTFSMDGDYCQLPELVRLKHAHDAWLMVDDAHAFGVRGDSGIGSVDPQHWSTDDVNVLIGTLGKAIGTAGAFVAGDEGLIETLIQRSRNYIFTTALPAAVAAATLTSLEISLAEQWRRNRLSDLVSRFRSGVMGLGLQLLPSESPIQPLLVGDTEETLRIAHHLEEHGCFAVPIRPPTVPVGTSRLRITFTAAHGEADVDRLLTELEAALSTR